MFQDSVGKQPNLYDYVLFVTRRRPKKSPNHLLSPEPSSPAEIAEREHILSVRNSQNYYESASNARNKVFEPLDFKGRNDAAWLRPLCGGSGHFALPHCVSGQWLNSDERMFKRASAEIKSCAENFIEAMRGKRIKELKYHCRDR
jgi:hypothetical protein